jgi:hypothetical protein
MEWRWKWLKSAATWTWLFVALGLGLRAYHYGRCPSLWHDEAVVLLNVLDKSFVELWGPLDHANPSPPLFLCLEKCVSLALGDNAYAWRLIPFLASCTALLLMVPIARRVIDSAAVPWAILLFACSDRLIWHSCEAKPYSVDLLCAVSLLAIFLRMGLWPICRQALVYALLCPLIIFLSYPGTMLCGGLLLALLPGVLRKHCIRTWSAYAGLGLVIGVSFGLLLLGPIRSQCSDGLVDFWPRQLPHWERPWSVPWWTIRSSFEMLRYIDKPTGSVLAIMLAVGALALWRQRQHGLLVVLVVPIILAVLAAYLRHYPYGHTRTMVYASPAVVLLIAAGVPRTLAWLRQRSRPAFALVVLVLVAPAGLSAQRTLDHWERPDSAGAARYIITHRSSSEPVVGTHWEHQYYFRSLRPMFGYVVYPLPRADHVWLIADGDTPENRLAYLERYVPAAWAILERCDDFEGISIFLLGRDPRLASN